MIVGLDKKLIWRTRLKRLIRSGLTPAYDEPAQTISAHSCIDQESPGYIKRETGTQAGFFVCPIQVRLQRMMEERNRSQRLVEGVQTMQLRREGLLVTKT